MRKLLCLLVITVTLSGCSWLYPSMMLRTPKGYKFAKLSDSTSSTEYQIAPNDFINMRLFSNDGFKLIDFTNIADNGGGGGSFYVTTGIEYLVRSDGTAKLPVIGDTYLAGMTIRQATQMLEDKYAQYYVKPYIILTVTNRRVLLFPGDPGTAVVLPLVNNNTTLLEALAMAKGISESGKAKQIKLIRGNPDKPDVYMIDLSTIDGIKAGGTILHANDIIYVTPQRRAALVLLNRITPTLSLISTLLLVIEIANTTKL